ncbi:MAG TPA: hypothetical protein VFU02_07080, partial [Polyangiaceae bacterium]|nr:hypothetical protein [Polyangiaceae bacterium]
MRNDQWEQGGQSTPLPALRAVGESRDLSQVEAAHLDGRLMHELSALNYLMAQYVLRHYDAEAGRSAPTSVADELALADSVTAAGNAIRARAQRR